MRHRLLSLILLFACLASPAALLCQPAAAPTIAFPLDSPEGLKAHHTQVEAVTYQGRRALKVVEAPSAKDGGTNVHTLVILPLADFEDGTIEVDLAGKPGPGAAPNARGFIGVAFRVAPEAATYECFYLRPTNGRAEDQVRRNHSTQYVSEPEFSWPRLRKEAPGQYESYVDLVPGEWTKVKIEVAGEKARLYVHGAAQPALIVNDLKLGTRKGAIALWIGPGTEGYFSDLRVSR